MVDKEILIQKGDTFTLDVYWYDSDVVVRKPITAISLASGAPRVTATGHGMASGMQAFVILVEGMTDINAEHPENISFYDMHPVTVVSADVVEFNGINPVKDNGQPWSAYTSGGFLCYYAPQSLAGVVASMSIYDRQDGVMWASSEASAAPLNIIGIVVDAANKKFSVSIPDDKTKALTAKKGVAEFRVTTLAGTKKRLKLTSTPVDTPDPVRVVNDNP